MIPLAALHALSMSTHCNDLPPWSYSHIDSLWPPGSGEACKNPYGQCATAGTPSDDAAYKFLRQLQPYHSCINSTHNADLAIRTAPKTLCPGKFVIDVFHIAYELDVLEIRLAEREAEWSDGELYVALPRPGGDAWLSLSSETGELEYESTDRGWIAYFNDLHKGRHTGEAWSWFIDFFAVACVVFSLTGLLLLQRHAGNRPSTWPLVGLGLVIPLLLALLFIH